MQCSEELWLKGQRAELTRGFWPRIWPVRDRSPKAFRLGHLWALCVCVCFFTPQPLLITAGRWAAIMIPFESRLLTIGDFFVVAYHRRCIQRDNFAKVSLRKDVLCRKPWKGNRCTDLPKPFTSGSRGQKPVIIKGSWHMQSCWTSIVLWVVSNPN